jgi:hypothetical protein
VEGPVKRMNSTMVKTLITPCSNKHSPHGGPAWHGKSEFPDGKSYNYLSQYTKTISPWLILLPWVNIVYHSIKLSP